MKFATASAVAALHVLFAPAVSTQTAASQAGSEISQAAADAAGEDVVVTGTRERGRTQFDTLAPIDVLPEALVQSSASSDLTTVLAQLLPSFNVQRLPAADGQAFVRPATLRCRPYRRRGGTECPRERDRLHAQCDRGAEGADPRLQSSDRRRCDPVRRPRL